MMHARQKPLFFVAASVSEWNSCDYAEVGGALAAQLVAGERTLRGKRTTYFNLPKRSLMPTPTSEILLR